MSFFPFIFEVRFGVRRGSIGHPIHLVLNMSSEFFPECSEGQFVAQDRNTTVTVASQELSQDSLSPVPPKKRLLVKSITGETGFSAQSDQVIRQRHGALW